MEYHHTNNSSGHWLIATVLLVCVFKIFMVMLNGGVLHSRYIYKKLKVTRFVKVIRFPPLGEGQRKRILRGGEINLLR